MSAELIPGFDRSEAFYDAMLPPEYPHPCPVCGVDEVNVGCDCEQDEPIDYSPPRVFRHPLGDWTYDGRGWVES